MKTLLLALCCALPALAQSPPSSGSIVNWIIVTSNSKLGPQGNGVVGGACSNYNTGYVNALTGDQIICKNPTPLVSRDGVYTVMTGGGATAPATPLVYKGTGAVNGVVAATPGTDYVAGSYPVQWAPLGSGSGQGLYDFFNTSFTDAVSSSGAGSAQYSGPGMWVGRNKNSSLSANQLFYSERLMDQSVLGGSSPWLFNANTANIFSKVTFPGTAAMVANTTDPTVGGTSAGNHVPQNTILAAGYGFGDSTGEFDAYGGMINGVFIRTQGDPQTSSIFPKYALNVNAAGGASSDTIPFNVLIGGVPQGGQAMAIYATGAIQNSLLFLKGPLDTPGGTVTADGAFADLYLQGNINDVGGKSINLDPSTGSSNATINLTGRNAGVAQPASVFADQNGGIGLTTKSSSGSITAAATVVNIDTGAGSTNSVLNLTGRNGGSARLAQVFADSNGALNLVSYSGSNVINATGALTEKLGYKFTCTHGTNGTCGVITLTAGAATISTTAIAALAASGGAGDVVHLECANNPATTTTTACTTQPVVSAITPGTSFAIGGTLTDTVYWEIRHIN